jgi:hypothetical protein
VSTLQTLALAALLLIAGMTASGLLVLAASLVRRAVT